MIRNINGLEYELIYKKVKNINLRISDGSVKVSAPRGTSAAYIDDFVASRSHIVSKALAREALRTVLPRPDISSAEAVRYFTDITRRIYPRFSHYAFPFPQIKTRIMKRQWGNCRSTAGLITYNKYLYGLPERLIEFIAAHELAHMVYADHSPRFYALMDEIMPDHRARRTELSEYTIR